LKKYLPLQGSAFSKFVVFLQFFYLYQVFVANDMGGFGFSVTDLTSVFFSMLTLWLFFRMIGTWFSTAKKAFLIANSVGIALYGLLTSYHFGTHEMVEWSFLADNFTSAFNREAVGVISSSFDPGGLYYIPLIILIWAGFEWKKKAVSKGMQTRPLLIKGLIVTALYCAAVLAPITPRDPVVAFFRSMWNYYHSNLLKGVVLPENEYPFLKNSSEFYTGTVPKTAEKPHVFLIVCESLNQSVINKKTPDGKEVTPFLNRLQSNSVHVSHFYGNSIQTAKGHFSILFSTIPSIVGKEANEFTDVRLQSLATVLQENGYKTTYFGAHRSKRFDNNYNFFTTHGFQEFVTSKTFTKPEDAKFSNNWGPQDGVFFKRFFEYFDAQPATNAQPQFVMLTTIYNHFPFNFLPEEQKQLYHGNTSFQQKYENSVHLTDKGLETFFKELDKRPALKKKALVIIVGDHGFPLGEHGNFSLPAGYHEESFRVPFFMVWADTLKPQEIEGPFSQMDIAPTVLDVLGIQNVQTNFQGTSILGTPPSSIFLIQPYERQLSLIVYPYKYRLDTRLNKPFVYNLKIDPMETTDICSRLEPEKKQFCENQIRRILLNQKAFEKDQFWPKTKLETLP